MTPDQIDRVFGRGRLKMVTGEHVEVFREAAHAGDRRRYTKRFLNTIEADFGQWTEREWRILARLIGHGIDCVPEVVQFDRGALGGTKLVQTYDAGATVDQWATILPVSRGARVLRHVFEDCAHWWALAHHCLRALLAIHELSVVHLDIKGDNVCIPVGPAGFDPDRPDSHMYPRFAELALIDFAFALVSRESLTTALPIGWQTEYDYQSPRLLRALEAGRRGDLRPTRELDWRCDMYSLAAMLKRYLPDDDAVVERGLESGWSPSRAGAAKELILALRDAHDREIAQRRPHHDLMQLTAERLSEADMAASLSSGWKLARDATVTPVAASPLTPLTRLAPSIRVMVSPRAREPMIAPPTAIRRRAPPAPATVPAPAVIPAPAPNARKSSATRVALMTALVVAGVAAVAAPLIYERWPAVSETMHSAVQRERPAAEPEAPRELPATPAPAPVAESAPTPDASTTPPAAASATPVSPAAAPPTRTAAAPCCAPARLARAPEDAARKTAKAGSRPAMPPMVGAKPSTGRLASAPPAAAQVRVRFHVPAPLPSESAAPSVPVQVALAPPPQSPPPIAAPVPEPLRAEPKAPEARVAPLPSEPRVMQAGPRTPPTSPATVSSAIAQDVRSVLGFILGFTKRTDQAMAPIDDRTLQSAPGAAGSPPRESVPAIESAPRSEPLRILPAPADSTQVAQASPDMLPRAPAPRTMPPTVVQPRMGDMAATDLAVQGRRALAESVPHTAARAEQEIARVLWLAANASHPAQERGIVDAVRRTWPSNVAPTAAVVAAPTVARRLSEDARQAYMAHRDVPGAFDLQLRAFGANSGDAEIAGNLAFLYLKLSPPLPETARQVAMHAIGITPAPLRAARVDDWQTFAVASALTGREADATNALYVAIALTRNLDRSCKAALGAVDAYGERLVAPVQAMMLRIRQQGRNHESPGCSWPSRWQSARGQF